MTSKKKTKPPEKNIPPIQPQEEEATPARYDVVCPSCQLSAYETTAHFNPDVQPTTASAQMKEPYKGWGWPDFNTQPPGEGIGWLECPGCGAPLTIAGRFLIRQQGDSK